MIQRIWQIIKEERKIILFLAVLGMLRAAHEISKFRINMSWLPSWDYPFGITTPPLDSYHVYGGLFVLVLIAGLRLKLRVSNIIVNTESGLKKAGVNTWWQSVIIVLGEMYLCYFWVFDLFYHGLFMKPEYYQWEYIIPFLTIIQGLV